VNLYSDVNSCNWDAVFDQLYLSNYATIQLLDQLARLEGVGDVFTFGGQDYSLRVWLDPDKLASRSMSAGDVVKVLREQNVQVAAGQIGQPPVPRGQDFQYPLSTQGRLVEPEQFADIILKTGADGEVTYLRDVSRTELGAKSQDQLLKLDASPPWAWRSFNCPARKPSTPPTGSNRRCASWQSAFRKDSNTPSRTTRRRSFANPWPRCSIRCSSRSSPLVAIVVLLFLQDWKSLLLPVM